MRNETNNVFVSTHNYSPDICHCKLIFTYRFLQNTFLISFCFAGASGCVADFGARNGLLAQRLLRQGYLYHKLRGTFSEFYGRCYGLISRFQVGLGSLLHRGLSGPGLCGGLVCGLKEIVGSNNFLARFIKMVSHYKRVGCGIHVLQRTACLEVSPAAVGGFAFLFGCAPVGQASDCGGSDLGTCLLVGWWEPNALAVCRPTGVCLLDFFCSGVRFGLLLSPYPCFISLLCLGLYVLGDGALVGRGSLVRAGCLCVLIRI